VVPARAFATTSLRVGARQTTNTPEIALATLIKRELSVLNVAVTVGVGNAEMTELTLHEYSKRVGQQVGQSRWFDVHQSRIDRFADVTEDWQFIHVDQAAAAKTPFGGTIAHGFLTLSLLAAMAHDGLPEIAGQKMAVNYGFDKVRFISPVRSGARVRARFVLRDVTHRSEKEVMMRTEVTIEIAGGEKPALTAEWFGISYLS
jgi:acyl dehydratase